VAARFDDRTIREAAHWRLRELRLTPFFIAQLSEGLADSALPIPEKG
jgi:hypothetical protein